MTLRVESLREALAHHTNNAKQASTEQSEAGRFRGGRYRGVVVRNGSGDIGTRKILAAEVCLSGRRTRAFQRLQDERVCGCKTPGHVEGPIAIQILIQREDELPKLAIKVDI